MSELGRAFDAAVTANEVAIHAELIGTRIQALSRLAMATWQTGNLEEALRQSAQAVRLLEVQEFIEGAEEQIYLLHAQLLVEAEDPECDSYFIRARREVERKLAIMEDSKWRLAFAALPVTRAALRGTNVARPV